MLAHPPFRFRGAAPSPRSGGDADDESVRLVPARVKSRRARRVYVAPAAATASSIAPSCRTSTVRCGNGISMPSRAKAFLISAR